MTLKTILKTAFFCCFCQFFILGNLTAQNETAKKAIIEAAVAPAPKMKFDKRFEEFGKVKKGEKRETVYSFTNVGDADLVIDLISACDCTTTDYPIHTIAPGEKGEIKVVFDSTEKEESETIDIDIYLQQRDPKTGAPIMEILQYHFDLVE